MTKLSIAVDLDSTLNNLEEVWILEKYNAYYNDNLTLEDMITWNVHEYVKPECGKKVYDILQEPGLFKNLSAKDEYTLEGIEYLYKHFDVYIVSSCHPSTIEDKVAWVKENLPFFDTKRFVSCHNKYLINTDFLIDDGPHNIMSFKQKSILIDATYNRHLKEEDYNFIRMRNWCEIKEYFEGLL